MGEGRRDYDYRIKKLSLYPEKGAKAVIVEEMVLCEGKGIQGDFHADGGERQISLLTEEKKRWMEAQEIKGFCFRKFKENILLEEASHGDYERPKTRSLLKAGDVVLELTESLKVCHPELCDLAKAGRACLLAGGHSFAKVKKGGTITAGMTVEVI